MVHAPQSTEAATEASPMGFGAGTTGGGTMSAVTSVTGTRSALPSVTSGTGTGKL
ncbi:hypothetical protein ACFYRY_04410 [Streptomyces sp. NPDC005263]|uniref:hypothetical protein n=1 Tax=Streptomyces sp. NPDC005263 TaxID=3364711 RepID=UPI0036912C5B